MKTNNPITESTLSSVGLQELYGDDFLICHIISITQPNTTVYDKGVKFIKFVLNTLRQNKELWKTEKLEYFLNIERDYALDFLKCESLKSGWMDGLTKHLYGQVRFSQLMIDYFNSVVENGDLPKYLSFGKPDAYYAPVSDKLYDKSVKAHRVNMNDSTHSYMGWLEKSEARVSSLPQCELRDLLIEFVRFEFTLLTALGHGSDDVDVHIIEGYKKALHISRQGGLALALSGCENGLTSMIGKPLYEQYLSETNELYNLWEIENHELTENEEERLEYLEESVYFNADGSELNFDEWVEQYHKELGISEETLKTRFLAPYIEVAAKAFFKLTRPCTTQIKFIPDLDYAWKPLVRAGWLKLLMAFHQHPRYQSKREQKRAADLRDLINLFEPNDGKSLIQRKLDKLTGFDDVRGDITNLKIIEIDKRTHKLIRSKSMFSKTTQQMKKAATLDAKSAYQSDLRALMSDSVKFSQYQIWANNNAQESRQLGYFINDNQWRLFSPISMIWEKVSDIEVENIVIRFLNYYHENVIGEEFPLINHSEIGKLVGFMKPCLLKRFNSENARLLADNRVLYTHNTNPQIINLEDEQIRDLNFTSKSAFCIPELGGDTVTVEDFPTINTLLSHLSNTEKEWNQLAAFLYATLTKLSYLSRHLMLVGIGGSGKSSFAELARQIAGVDATCNTSLRRWENNNFATSRAVDASLVVFSDEQPSYEQSNSNLKKLTSFEPIDIERKNRDATQAVINAMVLLIANQQPVSDSFSAMNRRFIVIQPPNTVTKPDPDFASKCYEELGVFIAWMLQKPHKEWVKILMNRDEMVAPDLRAEVDSVFGFMNLCLKESNTRNNQIRFGNAHNLNQLNLLYPAYRHYCAGVGAKYVGLLQFNRRTKDIVGSCAKFISCKISDFSFIGDYELDLSVIQ